jgi:hypothetical protein
MTDVPIGYVGVVISYIGEDGKDVTGDTFKHGNIVSKGQRGVWMEPLVPENTRSTNTQPNSKPFYQPGIELGQRQKRIARPRQKPVYHYGSV